MPHVGICLWHHCPRRLLSKNHAETLTYKTPGLHPKPAQVTFINSTPRSSIFSLFHRALFRRSCEKCCFLLHIAPLFKFSALSRSTSRRSHLENYNNLLGGLAADLKATKKRDLPVCVDTLIFRHTSCSIHDVLLSTKILSSYSHGPRREHGFNPPPPIILECCSWHLPKAAAESEWVRCLGDHANRNCNTCFAVHTLIASVSSLNHYEELECIWHA